MLPLSCSADKGVNARRLLVLLLLFLLLLNGCSLSKDSRETFNHTIAQGDTLFSLSQRYGVSIDEIKTFNDISNPRNLKVGQVVVIPRSRYRDYQLVPSDTNQEGHAGMSFSKLEIQQRLKIPLAWPLLEMKIISPFGDRTGTFHEGVDLKAAEGTLVYATHDGQVAYSGEGLSGYGNLLVLKGNGFFTVYAHNSQLLVEKGKFVKRGEVIAEVGQTGRASGPHLHFELRMRNGEGRYQAVDPVPFLVRAGG